METSIRRYQKLFVSFLSALLLAGGCLLTGCDNENLNTNPYDKSGVNLLGFGPCPLKRLDTMKILGTNLNEVDKVLFPKGNSLIETPVDYEEASFQLISNEELEVTVPDETVPGKLRLVVGADTIVSASNITFEEEVDIQSVSPLTGLHAGDVITITGEFVWNIATVTFNENVVVEAENFLVNTRKEIQVTVPKEAQSGELTMSTGVDGAEDITWDEPLDISQAVITSLSSENLDFGETLTIYGTDLGLVASVKFPMLTEETSFVVNEEGTEITVTVPLNTIPGRIMLTQYSGLIAESPQFVLPMVEVESISPVEDLRAGDVVTISGTNLDRVESMTLPGGIVLAKGDFEQQDTQIKFSVPADMGDGTVLLVQHENYSVETAKIAMYHAGGGTVIWSGTWTCTGWAGNQDLAWGAYDWSTFTLGQSIVFTVGFTDPTAASAIISPRRGNGWAALPSVGQFDLVPGETDQDVVYTPTADDMEALQNDGGLVITGDGFILKRVTIL